MMMMTAGLLTLGEEEKAEESQNLFMAESQWDCVGYGPKEAVQNKTKSQPKKKDKNKETKNKENIVPPSNTQPKNWPHLRALVSEDILLIILSTVDDCGYTSKLAANNSNNLTGKNRCGCTIIFMAASKLTIPIVTDSLEICGMSFKIQQS
jgi:hypothetical protein